jgi:hypothetical protein
MVAHWYREARNPAERTSRLRHRARLAINALGAAATAIALAIIIVAKFMEGAWITLLVIPCVILLLRAIKRYYTELDAQLRKDGPLDLRAIDPPVVLVATEGWNRLTDRALRFALRLSPDVMAVHLTRLAGPDCEEKEGDLRRQWTEDVATPATAAGLRPPRLVMLPASFRRIEAPLLALVESIEREFPGRAIAVLIPEIVKEHWWQYLLHQHRARRLRGALLRYGGSRLVVIAIPGYLEEPRIEGALEQEELRDAFEHQRLKQRAGKLR